MCVGFRAQVNHPSICKLLGVSVDQHHYTLVLEYVSGAQRVCQPPPSCMPPVLTNALLNSLIGGAPGTNLFDYLHKLHKTIPIGKQLGISVQVENVCTPCNSAMLALAGFGSCVVVASVCCSSLTCAA